ncbi:MAG: OsmC family protein [Planctomycetota bacterium]|jgi:putative redox protein
MSAEKPLTEYKNGVAPVNRATLRWDRDLVFTATTPRGYDLEFDAKTEWGCMPVEGLLMSLAGCMAIDVVSILTKMRCEPSGLTMEIEGERNPDPPQRFTRFRLVLSLDGDGLDEAKVRRAVSLSEEKYCSVLHSLREDVETVTEIRLNGKT